MKITKHAFRRARERLGLNKKAFKRAVELNKLPNYAFLIIENGVVVTVKNEYAVDRDCKKQIRKDKRLECLA